MATLQDHIAATSARTEQRPWYHLNGEERLAWLLVLPWIIGFVAFQLGPMLASLGLSLTEWRMFTPPKFIGLSNYAEMISGDPLVFQAFKVTTIYSVTSVPLRIALGVLVALLLNASVRGLAFIRTVYYLPATVSGVAVAMVWLLILNGDFGLLNRALSLLGLEGPYWLTDTRTVLASFVLMSLWSVGAGIIIYLAGLQGVPNELYEAAEVDGAGDWVMFWKITIPMISPVLFFQFVIGMIDALQEFAGPFIMTQGGPGNASLFVMLYLFRQGFEFFQMGYASALAWVLFVYIMLMTLFIIRSSAVWVYYEGEVKGN
ncbi:MAG: sugar ABC transporter permease [Caldilineaceae bacterium SB0664_bin_27]|uniref:Sugar ABC transporter permease n=1 Tax=Caldilineaceae bacterium SB0664_bin_27 TaxID=2605260 RepID=A0A6B0YZS4_9CHLR|nr:sugar ABC transporter permease [Caldilineaceae bacterium SB0664_bin_27]